MRFGSIALLSRDFTRLGIHSGNLESGIAVLASVPRIPARFLALINSSSNSFCERFSDRTPSAWPLLKPLWCDTIAVANIKATTVTARTSDLRLNFIREPQQVIYQCDLWDRSDEERKNNNTICQTEDKCVYAGFRDLERK